MGNGRATLLSQGCGCGCWYGFLVLACLLFGVPLATIGSANVDAAENRPRVPVGGLDAALEDEVLLSARLAGDHPTLAGTDLVAEQRHTQRRGTGARNVLFDDQQDEEASRTPPLRLRHGEATIAIESYRIVTSDAHRIGGESTDTVLHHVEGLRNGEAVGAWGTLVRRGDGYALEGDVRLLSGDAETFLAHYQASRWPFHQIGLGLLGLATLLIALALFWVPKTMRSAATASSSSREQS